MDKQINKKARLGIILINLATISFLVITAYLMVKNNVLPRAYRYSILGLGFLVPVISLVRAFAWKAGGTGTIILGLIWLVLSILIFYFVHTSISTLDKMNQDDDPTHSDGEDVKEAFDKGFIVYISGVDQYGSLDKDSRTDVNLVCAVDPKKQRMAILSVPRDSYLAIADGGMDQPDKLAHSGNYGIYSSIHTLENALNIDIDYYVRMNFSSFLKIIDQLGGVDVDNPQAFQAINGRYFEQGPLHLNSEDALMFVRERKHLPDGDFGRQKHQQMVLEAAFEKILSPQILTNFQDILTILGDSVETNVSTRFIMTFINSQLDGEGDWSFLSLPIEGESQIGLPSFAMPGSQLYFFVPDPACLYSNGQVLTDVVQGDFPDQADLDAILESYKNDYWAQHGEGGQNDPAGGQDGVNQENAPYQEGGSYQENGTY